MRTLLGVAMVLALACGVTAADDKLDAKKLVGKWEPKDPKKGDNVTMEFTKDGKLVFSGPGPGGKEQKIEGTYKLDGDKLSMKMMFMGETHEETVTVTKLTDDELEGKDKSGKVEAFKRVKGDKGKQDKKQEK